MENTPTPEQIEEMREMVAAADRARAAAAAVARDAYYLPAKLLVESDEFAAVLATVAHIAANYEDDGFFGAHVNALATIMPNLINTVDMYVPLPAPVDEEPPLPPAPVDEEPPLPPLPPAPEE